jgi:hypothetical protein
VTAEILTAYAHPFVDQKGLSGELDLWSHDLPSDLDIPSGLGVARG